MPTARRGLYVLRNSWPLKAVAMAPNGKFAAQWALFALFVEFVLVAAVTDDLRLEDAVRLWRILLLMFG